MSISREYSREKRRELVEKWRATFPWTGQAYAHITYKLERILEMDGPTGETVIENTPEMLGILKGYLFREHAIPGAYYTVLMKIGEIAFDDGRAGEILAGMTPDLLKSLNVKLDNYEKVVDEIDRVLSESKQKGRQLLRDTPEILKRQYGDVTGYSDKVRADYS